MTFSPRLKRGIPASTTTAQQPRLLRLTRCQTGVTSRVSHGTVCISLSGLLKPFTQNVNGSVFVAVVNRVTRRTFPFPDAKVLNLFVPVSAAGTGLAALIECRYTNYCTTVPIGFVLQHIKERRPRNTGNSSCKFMITKHSLYIKVFDADGLIFTHQHSRLFLKEIVSLISNLFVGGSDSYTLLFTIM